LLLFISSGNAAVVVRVAAAAASTFSLQFKFLILLVYRLASFHGVGPDLIFKRGKDGPSFVFSVLLAARHDLLASSLNSVSCFAGAVRVCRRTFL